MMRTTKKMKPMKAAKLFSREYGRAAYQAWLQREKWITDLSQKGRHAVREICRMREDNFRQMKAEGSLLAATKSSAVSVSAAA